VGRALPRRGLPWGGPLVYEFAGGLMQDEASIGDAPGAVVTAGSRLS